CTGNPGADTMALAGCGLGASSRYASVAARSTAPGTEAVGIGHSDFRPGHGVPLGAAAIGLGAVDAGRQRHPHCLGNSGPDDLERCAFLGESPFAAHALVASLSWPASFFCGGDAVFHLQLSPA